MRVVYFTENDGWVVGTRVSLPKRLFFSAVVLRGMADGRHIWTSGAAVPRMEGSKYTSDKAWS